MKHVASTLFVAPLCAAQGLVLQSDKSASSRCINLYFPVSATAQNRLLVDPPKDLTNLTEVIAFFSQPVVFQKTAGSYNLYGQFCTPTAPHAKLKAPLQILVHGNTYDHSYFSGFQSPPVSGSTALKYSWIDYATKQGYYTLAIDRLGTGRSDHPDPVAVLQAPLQVELVYDLISKNIKKVPNPLSEVFDKVIYVGHSYGSTMGTQLAATHPDAVDAFVFTGVAKQKDGDSPLPGQLANVYLQASSYDPVRFPPATYPPGYLVGTNKAARMNSYYSDPATDFDLAVYDKDFQRKETVTLGEAITPDIFTSQVFKGPVFVTAGNKDAIFCGNGTRLDGNPDCGKGATSQLAAFIKSYFPATTMSSFFAQPAAGHCQLLHYSWKDAVFEVHKFLGNL